MKAIVDISLIAIGASKSMSPLIAKCIKVFKRHNLKINIHAMGTNIEGDLEVILKSIHECHSILHSSNVARLLSTIKISTRIDKRQTLVEKIMAVKNKL